MTSDAMARDMIARARRCLREARTARDESDHALCIRRSQEVIELAWLEDWTTRAR
jgi:HEPN domain-containing protein